MDEDELPDVPALELTEDPAQLKNLARNLHRDLVKTRTEAGKRRIQLRTVEGERDRLKGEFETFKTTAETEKTGLKTELETANRSNGQLKTRFKDQFVNKAVMDELKKAGAADDAVPVILKALDLSKIEFDEETLTAKGHDVIIAEFKTATPSLFAGSKPTPRGTTPNSNGASNNGGNGGGGEATKIDFMSEDNKKKSFLELARESAVATIAGA
jgi:hypothetical protein